MWVVVTHIVSPNDFYVRYIAERRQSEVLSKKINQYCWKDSCRFVLDDMLETGVCLFKHIKRRAYSPEMLTQRVTTFCCCVSIWLHPSRLHDLRKVGRRRLVQSYHCGTEATRMCRACELLLGQPLGQCQGLLHWQWTHEKHQHTEVNKGRFLTVARINVTPVCFFFILT